jgi:1-aminocyclopropane-1-carboxylate deaminase
MQLEFISREKYNRKNEEYFQIDLTAKFGDHILIPEGGYSKDGVTGAALISNFYQQKKLDYICCSIATSTTLAGLINSSPFHYQKFLGFSAIKSYPDFKNRIQYILEKPLDKNVTLFEEYHFGGYAKKTHELLLFMNQFYEAFAVPTDFVYTGKMMFGVFDLINKNYFPRESRILCIHTGGLQGNLSLPTNSLNF